MTSQNTILTVMVMSRPPPSREPSAMPTVTREAGDTGHMEVMTLHCSRLILRSEQISLAVSPARHSLTPRKGEFWPDTEGISATRDTPVRQTNMVWENIITAKGLAGQEQTLAPARGLRTKTKSASNSLKKWMIGMSLEILSRLWFSTSGAISLTTVLKRLILRTRTTAGAMSRENIMISTIPTFMFKVGDTAARIVIWTRVTETDKF